MYANINVDDLPGLNFYSVCGALATLATFPLDIAPVMKLLEAVGVHKVVWVTTF